MEPIAVGMLLVFVMFAVAAMMGRHHARAAALFCTACGHEGQTRTRTKGHIAIEIILWLCLAVPGLIYSIWRRSARAPVCASCGSATVVPIGSPVARKMQRELAVAVKA